MNQILQVLVKQSCIFLLSFNSLVTEAQTVTVTNDLATEKEYVSAVKPLKMKKSNLGKQGKSDKDRSPFNATLAFTQARIDYQANRYAQTQGVYVRSHYEWFINQLDRVSALLSYRGERESVVTTPAPSNFDQSSMLNDEGNLGVGSYYPSFKRPKDIRLNLGWVQNIALGLQWQKQLADEFSTALSLGVHSQFIGKAEFNLSPWLCLDGDWKYFWLSLSYQGDPCMGINHAQSRLMLGLSLGRARLGAGWELNNLDSFDLSNHSLIDPEPGGAIAWLLLPLNASIYLEMSLAFAKQAWLWLDENRETGDQAAFMVGLTWTGESEIKELEAPKKMPATPNLPLNSNSPTQEKAVPQSQPLFSPSPLQPNSHPNSPSKPL